MLDNYPNLKAMVTGRVSGRITEWVLVVPELRRMEQELAYLTWFKQHADFGPADSDVHLLMDEEYRRTGGVVPKGWSYEEE